MSTLRAGVIGLGEVAQVIHLPVLEAMPHLFQVQAVCDVSPTLLKVVGDRYGVRERYLDATEMLETEDLDCVLVLNSDEYHTECVIAALRRDIDVLVEKPMCLSPGEAEEIIRARDGSAGKVMVAYMRRFAPAFLEAKDGLADLGRINYARVHDIIGRNHLIINQTSTVDRPVDIPQEILADRGERGRRLAREAIGPASDAHANAYRLLCGLGSHDLSAMRDLLGRPRGVTAARQWRDGRFLTALLDYDDFLVTYETGVDDQLRFDAHIEVYGETSSMRVQYDTPYVRHFPTVLFTEETSGDAYRCTTTRPHLKDPYTHELEYFHRCVTEGVQPKTSPEDSVEDLELFAEIIRMLRAHES